MTTLSPRTINACAIRSGIHSWREQICDTNAPEHFGTDAIGDAVDDFSAVLGWIDVGAERPLAERHQHDDLSRDHVAVGQMAEPQHAVDPLANQIDPAVAFAAAFSAGVAALSAQPAIVAAGPRVH
jgi:hypothetical protein